MWLQLGLLSTPVAPRIKKLVFLYPLGRNCREILLHSQRRRAPRPRTDPDKDFGRLWQYLSGALSSLAAEHDPGRSKHRRTLNTLLVMLFVLRLVFAPRRQGCTTMLAGRWAQCRLLDVPWSQPASATVLSQGLAKVDEAVFRQFHAAIIQTRRCARPPTRSWASRPCRPTSSTAWRGLAENLEALPLRHSELVQEVLAGVCAWIGTGRRRRCPGRRSLQPASQWDRRKDAKPGKQVRCRHRRKQR